MLEWLAAATGVELGKLVLEQVLNLSKSALEDYVKDFFKDCIQSGVALSNADTLKKPMAEAIGSFIKRFIKELQFNDVPESSIEHHFKATIKRFVQDKAVRPVLGKAFEQDCKQIDYAQLQEIWTQRYQVEGWQFPAEEFDWRGVAKEYVVEVKGIIKANAELRALLAIDLQEQQAASLKQIAGINPGFDVAQYRESLQTSYGYLKLYILDSTDRADTVKLWNMFIEQTVREALPPMRYELPSDLKRQLQEQGQLDELSPEALEQYRHEYFQQPSRKVLEAVAESQRAIVLGDPGAGKSTLLQYLALEWVEGKTKTLPLLIELREYALAQSVNFLDFLHCGRGADWQFDPQQLHQHLLENPTLVMFDGLDEVFDRPTQSTVIDDIIRFAQQYPQAKVLVTLRIIGYNPERFQHAGFRQFTIQPLDEAEIHEFIDRWYDLAMGSDSDKTRLKQRLKDAIDNSKAIANLADNLLLLTMMAILNRRQELPRDRADLYDQASRVLLYHWDVDHKRLQLPMDAIGRREKQEMLRLIAYEMQAGEEGLKGNLIGVDRLTRILTDYLCDQKFSEPREKANLLIQQLRERNFILCYRGADTYGFVHRTFLEYFCALEIVSRFEKVRSISFEQLRDEVFGQHWQDETWHEVLQLICGVLEEQVAGNIIEELVKQYEQCTNILCLKLASLCLLEIKNRHRIRDVDERLLNLLMSLVESWKYPSERTFRSDDNEPYAQICELIGKCWRYNLALFDWLQSIVKLDSRACFKTVTTRQ
ncbi:MAG TPA: NACHT domain-containing protein [Coleofasciculaceae cyanobacterium]|jgi:predicted NACHT family NTPase